MFVVGESKNSRSALGLAVSRRQRTFVGPLSVACGCWERFGSPGAQHATGASDTLAITQILFSF
jgi:hypothetical protein